MSKRTSCGKQKTNRNKKKKMCTLRLISTLTPREIKQLKFGGFNSPLSDYQPVISFRRFCKSKMSKASELSLPKFVPLVEKDEEIRLINNTDGVRLRVVSYNILGQCYVKSSYFPHSPPPCLRWKARSQAVLSTLKHLEADFLCIQELDEYESFYRGKVEGRDYSSIYVQRGGKKRDGCGIFYKRNRAELVLEEKIDYNDLVNYVQDGSSSPVKEPGDAPPDDNAPPDGPSMKGLDGRGDPNDPRVRLKRDCVGLMGAFKIKGIHDVIIVANTHLYWDPEWADVKLAQAKYLLSRLANFKKNVSNKFDCTPLVILCGDFNSTPGDKIYQYLVSGNSTDIETENSEELPVIPLHSVYAYIGGEPPFTNCTPDFTDTLDYIFFSSSEILKPVSSLELPRPESSDVVGGLPNYHHPSDHLPIGADFEVTRTYKLETESVASDLINLKINS